MILSFLIDEGAHCELRNEGELLMEKKERKKETMKRRQRNFPTRLVIKTNNNYI
jgi:hypothetical protein